MLVALETVCCIGSGARDLLRLADSVLDGGLPPLEEGRLRGAGIFTPVEALFAVSWETEGLGVGLSSPSSTTEKPKAFARGVISESILPTKYTR
jgi:hypothetical protein